MILTVLVIFLLAAVITAVLSFIGKCPVQVPVILLCVVEAIQVLPIK